MWRKVFTLLITIATAIFMVSALAGAQVIVQHDNRDDNYDSDDSNYDSQNYDQDSRDNYNPNYDRGRVGIDRYLDADVWTDRSDNEYYAGDNVRINYRVNRDAYVAIYSIDTRGRVHLLYPSQPSDNPWRRGGVTYSLPGPDDDFDLAVSGPDGTENIAIIASRDRFPIPNWYNGSGIICHDENRDDFMEYLHNRYFTRYDGQRFAYDREVLYVNEWEPSYFRPVYYPTYPSWAVCGNVYVDYPFGATIYVDGIYWGCAPLYVPAILVGWHYVTVYDPWGYCWEDRVHVSRYNTVVLNNTVIHTSNRIVSKYKEVREAGYRDPIRNGYPKYNEIVKKSGRVDAVPLVKSRGGAIRQRAEVDASSFVAPKKKFVRGSGTIVKTNEGYQTPSVGGEVERRSRTERKSVRSYQDPGTLDGFTPQTDKGGKSGTADRRTSGEVQGRTYEPLYEPSRVDGKSNSNGSSDYYQKKGGRVEERQRGNSSNQQVERRKQMTPATGGTAETPSRTKEAERRSPQQVEQKRSSDNSGGSSRGGEVKQRSNNGNSGNSGASSKGSSGGNNGEGRGKGRH